MTDDELKSVAEAGVAWCSEERFNRICTELLERRAIVDVQAKRIAKLERYMDVVHDSFHDEENCDCT